MIILVFFVNLYVVLAMHLGRQTGNKGTPVS